MKSLELTKPITTESLLKEFAETVSAVNESVMEKHREAVKLKPKNSDHSLAIEIEAQP